MREISLNVLDITQNSISAGASLIEIDVAEDSAADLLTISITDNGKGMTEQQIKSVTDPFYTTRTTRKVGLGVPLFKMAAEMSGGNFSIQSVVGEGTKVTAVFGLSNVDRMPLGDMTATVSLLVRCNPQLDFVYRRSRDDKSFTLDTREVRDILGAEVPLDSQDVLTWLEGFIRENTEELGSKA